MELVFIRHGFSEWNAKNLFTGWRDVNLTERGVEEAKAAGKKLFEKGYEFDIAFTSVFLNERHYGALQGLDKKATAEQYGDEQVHIWRRSYDISPPDLDPKDPNSAHNDRRYANIPSDVVPNAENLKLTLERALPFWEDQIAPAMLSGKRVLVVAHGNSLRALAKHIIGISDAEIMDFEIPTGQPLVLKLDDKLNYVEHYYL
ncbi:MAG: 2,3-bisphosphoglycerate-dependent phosphoglycerate mutase [Haemophilus parainfluenzae]|nr:2,3-bisphosphoglycerate-dependent phosphoglycerate mutase [Haemophilus parainfluenzae]